MLNNHLELEPHASHCLQTQKDSSSCLQQFPITCRAAELRIFAHGQGQNTVREPRGAQDAGGIRGRLDAQE